MILSTLPALVGCSKKPTPYPLSYRITTSTCDTGLRKFKDAAAMCTALQDDGLNNNCAREERRDYHESVCSGNAFQPVNSLAPEGPQTTPEQAISSQPAPAPVVPKPDAQPLLPLPPPDSRETPAPTVPPPATTTDTPAELSETTLANSFRIASIFWRGENDSRRLQSLTNSLNLPPMVLTKVTLAVGDLSLPDTLASSPATTFIIQNECSEENAPSSVPNAKTTSSPAPAVDSSSCDLSVASHNKENQNVAASAADSNGDSSSSATSVPVQVRICTEIKPSSSGICSEANQRLAEISLKDLTFQSESSPIAAELNLNDLFKAAMDGKTQATSSSVFVRLAQEGKKLMLFVVKAIDETSRSAQVLQFDFEPKP